MLWGGRNTENKYHWHVWGVHTVYGPHWLCPSSRHLCFPGLHCSGSRLLCRELSKTDPGFCALPRSKLLRLRFSDISQRHRLGWACILCPSQVQGAQATRCLASTLSQCTVHLTTSLAPAARFPGCTARALSQVCGVSSGELISDCNLPGRCQPSRIPERHG